MRLKLFLNEKYLHGEYKFGFELEGIYPFVTSFKQIHQELIHIDNIWRSGKVIDDTSVKNFDTDEQMSFEYTSPILSFTPQNIQKTITFLDRSLSILGVTTNNTCGFHVHLSFPHINSIDSFWVLCNLAMNKQMLNKIMTLNTYIDKYDFFDEDHANVNFLSRIKTSIEQKNLEQLSHEYNDSKYRVFRLHPQGTIEWRGPRNFLNDGDVKIIKQFFLLLWEVIGFISNALVNKQLNRISKKELYDVLKDKNPIFKKEKKLFSKDVKVKNAKARINDDNIVVWDDGTWINGTWINGIWKKGTWENGTWKEGTWESGTWEKGTWESGLWFYGFWLNGTWKSGTWYNGSWKDGIWKGGYWVNGDWYGGKWLKGSWSKGQIHSNKFKKMIYSSVNPKEFYELEKTFDTARELEWRVR